MTVTDKLVPYYIWLTFGFSNISTFVGIINFGILLITLITVKGIYIPAWAIIFIAGILIMFCTTIGYFFDNYTVWKRIVSYQNKNVNPELSRLCEDVDKIKKKLGIE